MRTCMEYQLWTFERNELFECSKWSYPNGLDVRTENAFIFISVFSVSCVSIKKVTFVLLWYKVHTWYRHDSAGDGWSRAYFQINLIVQFAKTTSLSFVYKLQHKQNMNTGTRVNAVCLKELKSNFIDSLYKQAYQLKVFLDNFFWHSMSFWRQWQNPFTWYSVDGFPETCADTLTNFRYFVDLFYCKANGQQFNDRPCSALWIVNFLSTVFFEI